MPVDPSIFNNIKNFQDYNMVNQDFLARQQAANLTNQTQSNVLKGQALYAAAQTGDPSTWQNTLQKLNANGIDTSDVPQDVASGAKYAEGLRQAQSPLGTLLNAASKLDTNSNAAAIAGGSVPADPNALANAVLTGKALSTAAQSPSQSAVTPAQAMSSPPSAFTQALSNPQAAANPPAAPITPVSPPTSLDGVLNNAQATPSFVPDPSKTVAANQAALEAYKSSPDYIQSSKKAEKLGTNQADASLQAINSGSMYDQVNQTIGAIKDIINSGKLPTGTGVLGIPFPAGAKATLNQNTSVLGDPSIAQAYDNFNKLNEAQTIGAIKELNSTGQIRMTRTLENIINKGYLIDPNSTDASKISQANIIQNELRNSAVAAQNVNAQLNGGPAAQMASPLSEPPSAVMGAPLAPSGIPITIQNAPPTLVKSLPHISEPNDPQFQQLQPNAQFFGPDGKGNIILRTKH